MKIFIVTMLALGIALGGCSKKADTNTASSVTTEVSASPDAGASAQAAPTESPAAAVAAVTTASASADPYASITFTDISGIFAARAIKAEAYLGVFDKTNGAFNPYGTLTRAEYVRWLVRANNAYYKGAPSIQIRLAEADSDQSFVDVPKSNLDFKYIQGMANTGYVIGINKNHFAPDRQLTREEMIAILDSRELGANAPKTSGPLDKKYLDDADQISKPYWGLFNMDFWQPGYNPGIGTTSRIFGATKVLHPRKHATRAEAAIAIQVIGNTNYNAVNLAPPQPSSSPH